MHHNIMQKSPLLHCKTFIKNKLNVEITSRGLRLFVFLPVEKTVYQILSPLLHIKTEQSIFWVITPQTSAV